MTLRNGKFYDSDGNVVPLEFGNKEQIKLMNEEKNRVDCFTGDGLPVSIDIDERVVYDFQIRFKCICGKQIYRDYESDESDDFEGILKRGFFCSECKRGYIAEIDPDDLEVALIRLKK